jgi:hypothetical protein
LRFDRRVANMRLEIKKATAVLVGTALWTCRRTADLTSFHFGKKEQTRTFRGELAQVGEYALHVQCAWRIARGEKVVVGSADLYYPPDLTVERIPKNFDWDKAPNRLDKLLRLLFEGDKQQFIVQGVEVGTAGSLHITMDDNLSLDVLPNNSLSDEHWRLFKPSSEEPHFVLSGDSLPS